MLVSASLLLSMAKPDHVALLLFHRTCSAPRRVTSTCADVDSRTCSRSLAVVQIWDMVW